ncbi:MAG: nicotinamide-nucleotide amidohydrolase family protein [Nitrospirae bacterium]|nr:nicotinamide-nucleotide amidohydrolase family protein [Nitrospirota bacterium]
MTHTALEARLIADSALLATKVVRLASELGKTLGLAESCTGGLVSAFITGVDGSSKIYAGGVVSYSNDVKESLLGVAHSTLDSHGAVSPETAVEMACGVRLNLGVDVGLSVTGIAGPGGGSVEKPVGLLYVAVSGPEDRQECRRLLFSGSRRVVRLLTAKRALEMLLKFLSAT